MPIIDNGPCGSLGWLGGDFAFSASFLILHTKYQLCSPVLVNVSAVCGLVMATLYCLLDTRALILSPEVVSITPTQWATFIGTPVKGLCCNIIN